MVSQEGEWSQRRGVVSQLEGGVVSQRREWSHTEGEWSQRKFILVQIYNVPCSLVHMQLSSSHKAYLCKVEVGGGLGTSCRGSHIRVQLLLYHL